MWLGYKIVSYNGKRQIFVAEDGGLNYYIKLIQKKTLMHIMKILQLQ